MTEHASTQPNPRAVMVDFTPLVCSFCGTSADGTAVGRVFPCPGCSQLTCYGCVFLIDAANQCVHDANEYLTRRDWDDD